MKSTGTAADRAATAGLGSLWGRLLLVWPLGLGGDGEGRDHPKKWGQETSPGQGGQTLH